jgi:hypothetical protein
MTDQRPGAEFFGHPPQSQPSPTAKPQPATATPTFGPPSNPPRPATPSSPAGPPPSMTAAVITTAGSTNTGSGRPPSAPAAPLPMAEGVMARAKADDPRALEILFAQFVPPGEEIVETRYMGVMGLWGIGTHSFAAVTTQRVASLEIGLLGALRYQDGSLEYINSSAIFQPSRLRLYLPAALWVLVVFALTLSYSVAFGAAAIIPLLATVLALLLVPLVIKITYRFVKSGLLVWVREGMTMLVFIDRRRIALANRFYRLSSELRDERIREIGRP